MFLHRVSETPNRDAYMYPEGDDWKTLTWGQAGAKVRSISGGLHSLGLQRQERCAILCSTRYEWVLADLGIMSATGATTTIYPSTTPDDCVYILNDSGAVFAFAENDEQVRKLATRREDLPSLKKIIVIDGKASDDGWVMTFAELVALGDEWNSANAGNHEDIVKAIDSEDLATLIYTSGTTGKPKGVYLVHDCWVFEGEGIESLGFITIDDVQYFWLPLAHSFGKVLEAGQIKIGFVTAIDGRLDKLVANLSAVRPTFVCAVPRIFEKVHNKVVAKPAEAGGLKLKIFKWAFEVGRQVSRLRQAGQEPSGLLGMQYAIATKLVFSKLHALFGGRLRAFISGSAPLSRQMAEFFHAAGILILEGYGLTETSAASFVNRPEKYKFGTVGIPIGSTEVKIAEDGEILLKGRGVMRRYHNLPEETSATLDADGWLHTGDIGEVDGDGFLKITDRKKELIKTSGGKYVAPQGIEGRFKALCPFASQMLVHGNNRNFCSALVSLDEESIRKWASDNGVGGATYGEIVGDPRTFKLLQGFVDELNRDLASYESIKKFAILPKDLSEADGDLTPSQKLKRKSVESKYKAILDGFYEGQIADG